MQQQQQRTFAGMYKLRDWIREEDLDFHKLCLNPHPAAMHLISEMPKRAWWRWLSANSAAIDLIQWHDELIDWDGLSRNPHPVAIELLRKNPTRINWYEFPGNTSPDAVKMVKANIMKIECERVLLRNPAAVDFILSQELDVIDHLPILAGNPAPAIVAYVEEHMREFLETCHDEDWREEFWFSLSRNRGAIHILEKNIQDGMDNIDWFALAKMPEALPLVEKYYNFRNLTPETRTWVEHSQAFHGLCHNPAAIDVLERLSKYHGIHDWDNLSTNPAIFEYDYAAMREARAQLNFEAMAEFWRPDRVTMMECTDDNEPTGWESVLSV